MGARKKKGTPKKASRKSTPRKKARRKKAPTAGRASLRKKKAATRTRARPDPDPDHCVLRSSEGGVLTLPLGPAMQRAAMSWAYKVRNRGRWIDSESTRRQLREYALAQLAELHAESGISESDARDAVEAFLATATAAEDPVIEVRIPFVDESVDWEGRVLPWEFLVSGAARQIRSGRHILITRHLDRIEAEPTPGASPQNLMFVQGDTGVFQEEFTFEQEREIVKNRLALEHIEVVANPKLSTIEQRCQEQAPGIVHISAIDAYQGAEILGEDQRKISRDGIYLADENSGDPVLVPAEQLARSLNQASEHPSLVLFNAHNSGARLAAMTVAEGAHAAIGFQADFEDLAAEAFISRFYLAARHSLAEDDEPILDAIRVFDAFRAAWEGVRQHHSMRGSGIVLWTHESIMDSPHGASDKIKRQLDEALEEDLSPEDPHDRRAALKRVVHADIAPSRYLNYSVLHNGGNLFDRFRLRLLKPGRLPDVYVEVTLRVGHHQFPYKANIDLPKPDLERAIRVPLTWDYIRTISESIRTSVHVRISQRDTTILENTYPVTLDPTEEWIDNKWSGPWLPSFILPRDPAVAKIIDRAQRYLCALMDSASAGFDGYQGVDFDSDFPTESVDLQVRAIWSALVYDYDIGYINPPPSYSKAMAEIENRRLGATAPETRSPSASFDGRHGDDISRIEPVQRIRRPSAVLDGGRGTCIDLAVLLASCLEYIEVHPVLFLLHGHCFVGYWTSEQAYDDFQEVSEGRYREVESGNGPVSDGVRKQDWITDAASYGEIVRLVNEGDLVPLEAVCMTQKEGFATAFEQGVENLLVEEEFDCLVDSLKARTDGVTPLPL